jgi:heterodisulfide reductase subunit A
VLRKDSWPVEPLVAKVNEDMCSGCRVCESACGFHAITVEKTGDKQLAKVTEGLCRGCGVCASACPVEAIMMPNYSDRQIMVQIGAVMQKETRA